MNLLLVNDTSTSDNMGCQVTMFMLNLVLGKVFPTASIERIYLTTINYPFTSEERLDLLPSPRTSMGESVNRIVHSKLPVFQDVVHKLEWADLILINGEGSVIEDQPNALMIYVICELAYKLKTECHLINFTAHLTKPSARELALQAFNKCRTVAVREPVSYYNVRQFFPNVRLFPDVVIGLSMELPQIDIDDQCHSPIVMIGGSSATKKMEKRPSGMRHYLGRLVGIRQSSSRLEQLKKSYQKLCYRLAEQGFSVRLMGWSRDEWLTQLANGTSIVYEQDNFVNYFSVARLAKVNFTGRHHGCVMSSSAGCPFITTTANSYKTLGDKLLYGSPAPLQQLERFDPNLAFNVINKILLHAEYYKQQIIERRNMLMPFYDAALHNIDARIPDLIDTKLVPCKADWDG